MWNDPAIFKLCEALREAGRVPIFAEGRRLARGFADLGYEEFVLLPNGKLMSLFSGTVAPFPEEHKKFFIEIPSFSLAIEELEANGATIKNLERKDARSWTMTVQFDNGAVIEKTSSSIEALAILALIEFFKVKHVQAA